MSGFDLDSDQQKKLAKFLKPHYAAMHDFGAIGGELTYEFTPTNIGLRVVVVFCKGMPFEASIDLTDYWSW